MVEPAEFVICRKQSTGKICAKFVTELIYMFKKQCQFDIRNRYDRSRLYDMSIIGNKPLKRHNQTTENDSPF